MPATARRQPRPDAPGPRPLESHYGAIGIPAVAAAARYHAETEAVRPARVRPAGATTATGADNEGWPAGHVPSFRDLA